MIDVLYYMYYLFYLKKLKDEEPHARTIWFLGIFFSYCEYGDGEAGYGYAGLSEK